MNSLGGAYIKKKGILKKFNKDSTCLLTSLHNQYPPATSITIKILSLHYKSSNQKI